MEEGSLCVEEMRTPWGPIGKGRVDDEAGCAGRVKGPGGCEDRCSVWEAVACEDACRGVDDGPRRCGDRARKSRAEEAARPAQEGPRLCQEARDRTGDQEARGRKSLCRQGGVGLRRALLSSCQEAGDRTGDQEARGRKSLGSEEAFRSVLEAVAEAACRGAEEGFRRCGLRDSKTRTVPCRQGGVGLRRALLSSSTSFDLCSRLRRLRFRLESPPGTSATPVSRRQRFAIDRSGNLDGLGPSFGNAPAVIQPSLFPGSLIPHDLSKRSNAC